MRDLKGYIMVMGAALFWGLSATVARFLLVRNVDALLIVQSRVTISCLLMLAFFAVRSPRILRVKRRDLWQFAVLGVFGVAGSNFTYYFTIRESTVATAIVIQYTAPLVVMAYAALSRQEPVTGIKLLAASVSLIGCFLAVGAYDPAVLKITTLGLVTGIASIFCWAFLTVYTRHVLARHGIWTVTFYSIAFASMFWLFVNPPWKVMEQIAAPGLLPGLAGLAVISILIPHSLYVGALRHIVPSRAIITSTLEPVVAIVSAAIALGELLSPLQAFGSVLVIVAIVLLQIRREPGTAMVEVSNAS